MGGDVPLAALTALLILLLCLSAFFSGSETALMSLNRYRLRHKAREGHGGAVRAERLLQRPDRLIGLILLGNNLVNFSAASLVAVIALNLGGEPAVALATLLLTLAVLVFAETAPKTFAALHPEGFAWLAAYVYHPLLKLLYPFVWFINALPNGLLRACGFRAETGHGHALSPEELRTVVFEASTRISRRYHHMLLGILDLENVTVDDVMVPRNEIVGIDIGTDMEQILSEIRRSSHSRLPVYRDRIDHVEGVLHVRRLTGVERALDKDALKRLLEEPYYVPEGTPLGIQLVQFQKARQRFALVVDEYGDIQGLVTLEDILEEIVGEIGTPPAGPDEEIVPEGKETYLIAGTANLREVNRLMNWSLPTDGPKTLNGLIVEYLETIPASGTGVRIAGYPIEIVETNDNRVRTARVHAGLVRPE